MTATNGNTQTLSNGLLRVTVNLPDISTITDLVAAIGVGQAARIENGSLGFSALTDVEITIGAATEAKAFFGLGGAALWPIGRADDLLSGQNEAIRIKSSVAVSCKGYVDLIVGPTP